MCSRRRSVVVRGVGRGGRGGSGGRRAGGEGRGGGRGKGRGKGTGSNKREIGTENRHTGGVN